MLSFEILMDPEKYGYKECLHCNGYGSSLKEEVEICSECDGSGVVKNEEKESDDQRN